MLHCGNLTEDSKILNCHTELVDTIFDKMQYVISTEFSHGCDSKIIGGGGAEGEKPKQTPC